MAGAVRVKRGVSDGVDMVLDIACPETGSGGAFLVVLLL
tara:strand:+ start:83 stop:199 length:117 start_codon:yes stop_codon:yes gene_type:complete